MEIADQAPKTKKDTDVGLATNRGLTRELNYRDGYPGIGVFDLLGIAMQDLENKRVLDVGIGGGRALAHAMEFGLDYHGVDILPLVNTDSFSPLRKENVEHMQRFFAALQAQYPDRLRGADFCAVDIPYSTNQFDVVLSTGALPGYASDERQARLSILNMVKVAGERVLTHGGRDPTDSPKGEVNLGKGNTNFSFPMQEFLNSLSQANITYNNREVEGNRKVYVLDIDTTAKNSEVIDRMISELK